MPVPSRLRPADPPARDRRARAVRFGRRAEWLALAWLMAKGYRPLARNYVVKGGEIDIVVRRGDTIVFVEVKARPTIEAAQVILTPAQRHRIARAAQTWLARHPWAARMTVRGDGVFVAARRWPRHVEDAFPLDLG